MAIWVGAAVIAASHEERTSDVLADRVVTMSGGMVIGGVLPVEAEDQPRPGAGAAGVVLGDGRGQVPETSATEVISAV